MTDSSYSVVVYIRSTPRGRWRRWQSFPSGVAAAAAILDAKVRGRIRGETLTVFNGSDPNKETK